MIKQFMSKQFLMFVLTGGFAAVVNFGSRILYSRWVPFSAAVVLAYITGMITAFILAKIFVFKESTQSVQRFAAGFTVVNLFAAALTWVISMGLAYYVTPGTHDRHRPPLSGHNPTHEDVWRIPRWPEVFRSTESSRLRAAELRAPICARIERT